MKALLSILASMLSLCGASVAFAQNDSPAVDTTNWSLVWSDEFDGDALDMSKWSYQIDCWGGGNDERQCYTDDPKNLSVKDGKLNITAHKERVKGFAWPEHMRSSDKRAAETKKQPFSSGRIRSLGKGDWRYGRFDIRAKLPTGQGTWPAIWMLPSEEAYGGWAASGEIDIMEAVNLGAKCKACKGGKENRILGTLHYGDEWPDNENSGEETPLPGAIDGYHTYSLVWSAGVMTWYVDGQRYARQTFKDWNSESAEAEGNILAPFDQSFHMILNLAIGGSWPESVNEKGLKKKGFPKTMEVDFVRVYQCASDPEEGLDCISL